MSANVAAQPTSRPTRPGAKRPQSQQKAAPKRKQQQAGSLEYRFMKMQFSVGKRIVLFRQLASLVRNNIPLIRALENMIMLANEDKKQRKAPETFAIREWYKHMKGGQTFSHAISEWVSPAESAIIVAGESGARLPNALDDVVVLLEGMRTIRRNIIGAIAYPCVIVLGIIVMLSVMAYQVLPSFASVYPAEHWTGSAATLNLLATVTRDWAIPLGILFAIATWGFLRTLPRWRGKLRTWADQRPPYSIYRLWNGIGFLLAMAALMRAGISDVDSLRRIREYGNAWLRERIDACIQNMNDGANAAEALHRAGHQFPDRKLLGQMRIYANNSDFNEAVDNMARDALNEVIYLIKAQSATLNMILLFVLAGIVAMIGLGLYDLLGQITTNAR